MDMFTLEQVETILTMMQRHGYSLNDAIAFIKDEERVFINQDSRG